MHPVTDWKCKIVIVDKSSKKTPKRDENVDGMSELKLKT